VLASAKFKKFFDEEKHWLVPYAQYCCLRDRYGTADYSQWPDHKRWDEHDRAALSSARTKQYKEVAYSYFVQFILYTQMCEVHEYARQHGVILKGDIPIGVNRYGCDVWQEPRYFNLNGQAGAPPDDFSVNGQNWGFPTYNWEAMLKDDCAWWVRRFQNMAKYFDAYRIDHVLGFFRIWEIPVDAVHGLLGQFAPALAMTREEIEAYGLHFQDELFLEPFIMDWVLERIFKERAGEVKEKYLEPTHDGRYRMKPEFDTQRKVEKAFEGVTEEKELWLRDGLYALISDVLFVRDHRNPEKFHPRISAQLDFIYESLYDSDKFVFNKIYNDYYYRRNNQFWYREAMKKLPLLVQATRMLVCAEDLGMVPDCVPWVMNELRILSLELQSMPKDPSVKFGHLSRNPYRSVCTISSHDMPTLRMWWDEDEQRTQEYYSTMLYRGDSAPHPLPGWLARDIISRHLTCPSMLCVLALQDWLAIDERLRLPDANAERVNIPANPRHYWRYRMHLNIEDLLAADAFNQEISTLILQSGRK
jgi:4-alpha-glucanotransferase